MGPRIGLALLAAAVATAGCTPFYLPKLTRAGREVTVYDDLAKVPSTCSVVREATVSDGNSSYAVGYTYDGTKDGALIRLRKLAAAEHGDAVFIFEPDFQKICVDCDDS